MSRKRKTKPQPPLSHAGKFTASAGDLTVTKATAVKQFDVYMVRTEGREIAGTTRRAHGVSLVAVELGWLEPRQPPEGTIQRLGTFLAHTKAEAIAEARGNPKP